MLSDHLNQPLALNWLSVVNNNAADIYAENVVRYERIPKYKYQFFAGNRDRFPEFYEQEFDSLEDVEDAMRTYSEQNCFKIRLSNVDKDKNGDVRMRRFVCACQGQSLKRKRSSGLSTASEEDLFPSRRSARCGCPYFAVFKRMASKIDSKKQVFRIYSLDSFHNHQTVRLESEVRTDSISTESCDSESDSVSRLTDKDQKSLQRLIGRIEVLASMSDKNYQSIVDRLLPICNDVSLRPANSSIYEILKFASYETELEWP